MLRSIIIALAISVVAVSAQNPLGYGLPGQFPQQAQLQMPLGSSFGAQIPWASQQQPGSQFNQPFAGGFNPYLMSAGVAQAQPMANYPGVVQGWANMLNTVQQQPIFAGVIPQQQQQFPLGLAGATGITGISSTVPPVLPQNFGNPGASFGQLGQPVLSPQQLQQVVPTQQLQEALNQRVASFAPIGAPTRI